MSDVVYSHSLEWKAFNVSMPAVQAWFENNTSAFVGLSADVNLKAHFIAVPSDEEKAAIDAYWDSLVDDGAYAAEQAKTHALLVEKTKIQYGIDVRAYLGYLCELHSFTPSQYGQILTDTDLAFCSNLLISGALESCKGIIEAYTPTEYFTEDMVSGMSLELDKYITLANSL
jgi:hypothetical protein